MKSTKSVHGLALFSGLLLAATASAATERAGDSDRTQTAMDGVIVEAVERYPNPNRSEIHLGLGLYPFDPYFNAFAFNAGYSYTMSRTFTWEIVNFNYLYTVQKGLREQLADEFGLAPEQIERPKLAISTQAVFTHSYGKFVFLDDKIRYFRSGFMLGAGVFQTSRQSLPTANVGVRLDMYVGPAFSWKVDIRDHVAVTGGFEQFVIFSLLGSLSF